MESESVVLTFNAGVRVLAAFVHPSGSTSDDIAYFLVLDLCLLPPFSAGVLGGSRLPSWFLQSWMKGQILDCFRVHSMLV